MINSLERTFALGFKNIRRPYATGCVIRAIVNKDNVKFSFGADGKRHELDEEINIFLGLLFSDVEAFVKMIHERLSYVPFTKKSIYVNKYCDYFDWEYITKKMQEPMEYEYWDGIEKGVIPLKFKNENDSSTLYLERINEKVYSFSCYYEGDLFGEETSILTNTFIKDFSEYLDVVSNEEKKLKLDW